MTGTTSHLETPLRLLHAQLTGPPPVLSEVVMCNYVDITYAHATYCSNCIHVFAQSNPPPPPPHVADHPEPASILHDIYAGYDIYTLAAAEAPQDETSSFRPPWQWPLDLTSTDLLDTFQNVSGVTARGMSAFPGDWDVCRKLCSWWVRIDLIEGKQCW